MRIFWLILSAVGCLGASRVEVELGKTTHIVRGPLVGAPRAAFGSGTYLAVWSEGWAGQGATADIMGIRIAPGTLDPIDKEPIRICPAPEAQDEPVIAFANGMFLVAWQDLRNGKDLDIRAVLVDGLTGKPVSAEIEVAGGAGNQARPAVSSDGESFLLVWQDIRGRDTYGISGIRISFSGKFLDPAPASLAERGSSPAVCGSGSGFLVTWAEGRSCHGALVDASTGNVKKRLGIINSACSDGTSIAHDGSGNFMTASAREPYPNSWGWPGPGAVLCSRVGADGTVPEAGLKYGYRQGNICSRSVPNVVDSATWGSSKGWEAGAPGGFKGTASGLWPNGWPSVVWDGRGSYLFAWVRGRIAEDHLNLSGFRVWLRGMSADTLEVTTADQEAAMDEGGDLIRPALVAGPPGEILLLFLQVQQGKGRAIAARRIAVKR